jgi:Flp pilus assembly protein TadB
MITSAAVWSALAGAGTGVGLFLCAAGLRGVDPGRATPGERLRLLVRRFGAPPRKLLLLVAVAVLAGVVTGWVVGGLLAGLAAWALPPVLGRDREQAARLARIEAVAGWTEMLRDTLSGAAGIEQAVLATADLAPEAIRDEVAALAAAIGTGERLAPALRRFGEDLDDPIGDLVVAALVLAVERQARQLGDLLGSLARSAREQASMRMRVEAGRARTRTSVRVVVGTTLLFAVVATALNRAYLGAYDGIAGQVVLAVVGALFCGGFVWLLRISRIAEPERFLGRSATVVAPR